MALQITITYTPGFTSTSLDSPFICHRICYRQNETGTYCCLEDTTDSFVGVVKTFVIDVDETTSPPTCISIPDVDPESCVNTEYDGYVQACCEEESSTAGRVYWSSTFTPDPSCVNKTTCCQNSRPLTTGSFVITTGGTGYTALSTVPVTIVRDPLDTETLDAVVTANVNGSGVIVTFNVTSGGLYNKIPLAVIDPPTSGTQARALVKVLCLDTETGSANNGYWDTCEDTGVGTKVELLLGECTHHCYPKSHPFVYNAMALTGSPDLTNYTYAPGGCCDCTTCGDYTVVVNSTKSSITLCYTRCSYFGTPSNQQCDIFSGSGSLNFSCVVPDSIYCLEDPNAIVSIVNTGPGTCCLIL